ncbi:hypothetical protein CSOJ01_01878 [Colletotrichum sojae]|uniref:Uncharacterized protein n=1 Tax=Colletotrichum sojae TaxID=2175907 RepID=A0A8H6JTP5_9PEZI|nr:hypothetical protein CSOJ01_01878 [Colletotrichum sojae]
MPTKHNPDFAFHSTSKQASDGHLHRRIAFRMRPIHALAEPYPYYATVYDWLPWGTTQIALPSSRSRGRNPIHHDTRLGCLETWQTAEEARNMRLDGGKKGHPELLPDWADPTRTSPSAPMHYRETQDKDNKETSATASGDVGDKPEVDTSKLTFHSDSSSDSNRGFSTALLL